MIRKCFYDSHLKQKLSQIWQKFIEFPFRKIFLFPKIYRKNFANIRNFWQKSFVFQRFCKNVNKKFRKRYKFSRNIFVKIFVNFSEFPQKYYSRIKDCLFLESFAVHQIRIRILIQADLYWLTCTSSPVWLSHTGYLVDCPVSVFLSQLSCPSLPVPAAVMSSLACRS